MCSIMWISSFIWLFFKFNVNINTVKKSVSIDLIFKDWTVLGKAKVAENMEKKTILSCDSEFHTEFWTLVSSDTLGIMP